MNLAEQRGLRPFGFSQEAVECEFVVERRNDEAFALRRSLNRRQQDQPPVDKVSIVVRLDRVFMDIIFDD
jgi:hypothetical protein